MRGTKPNISTARHGHFSQNHSKLILRYWSSEMMMLNQLPKLYQNLDIPEELTALTMDSFIVGLRRHFGSLG
jgi:hypothetical protein